MADAREVARRVVARALREDAYVSLALAGELDRARLDPRDAALATELAYSTLRNLRRLDRALEACAERGLAKTSAKVRALLRVAACEILLIESIPSRAAVHEAVGAARRVGGARVAGFVNAVLRRLASGGEPPPPSESRERIATLASLPDWILAELEASLEMPDELEPAAAALSATPALGLRVNRRRADRAGLIERLAAEAPRAELAPHPLAPSAIAARRLGSPERLPAFAAGLFSIQDAAAQAVGELAGAAEASSILDACAGVGGKACHLAELAGPEGRIDAADIDSRKLEKLQLAAARLGIDSIRAVEVDVLAAGDRLAPSYDLVVLDAPCTGLGVLRRHPEAKWRLEPAAIERMAALQARLLAAAFDRVAPGGALVYAVCTFTRREGPEQIERLLAARPELSLESTLRTWPHRDEADAFFAARLRRA